MPSYQAIQVRTDGREKKYRERERGGRGVWGDAHQILYNLYVLAMLLSDLITLINPAFDAHVTFPADAPSLSASCGDTAPEGGGGGAAAAPAPAPACTPAPVRKEEYTKSNV